MACRQLLKGNGDAYIICGPQVGALHRLIRDTARFRSKEQRPHRSTLFPRLRMAGATRFHTACLLREEVERADIVPDNVAVIDNAFKLRIEAEKYLFTCYSFLPKNGDGWFNAGMMSGDEIWMPQTDQATWHPAFRIAQGEQNRNAPWFDEWGGDRKGGDGRFNYLNM